MKLLPVPSPVPVPVPVPVPKPVPVVKVGWVNPNNWFVLVTKLLNPVPKPVLNPVGAVPKPGKPVPVVAKPLLKPLLNVPPVNCEPKTRGNVALGWKKPFGNWKLPPVPVVGVMP